MRFALITLLALLGFLAPLSVSIPSCRAEGGQFAPGRKSANLKEMLEAGLEVRRPQDFAFVSRVIEMVEERRLPDTLVRSTFDWARFKRPYPFPFFERGLKVRAARLGILVR